MTKGLKIWLYLCITGIFVGAALLLGSGANAADGTNSSSDTTSSTTQKANGDTVTNKTSTADTSNDWLAPGGLITVSIGGIFMIVREVKSIKDLDVQKFKTRAETAEAKVETETSKLATQIERLESKLDKALDDVEKKHDEMVAEVAHRRKLEVLLAENGISVPATQVGVDITVTG
jgi:F0F1-type ATP synthase epsilon subunit